MAIRLPLQNVLLAVDTGNLGATSVAGGSGFLFTVPQDTDNIVVKFQASISGAGVSAVLQTTDDGGTTWYDVARTSILSKANATTAEWLSAPVVSAGINPIIVSAAKSGSVLGGTIGTAGGSTLGSRQVSGLPILSQLNRIFFIYSGDVTASSLVQAKVMVNSQSATA